MNTEHVDIGVARYSDWAFTSSVVVLVAALLLLAVELAYSRGRRVESRELVGAAAAATLGRGAPRSARTASPLASSPTRRSARWTSASARPGWRWSMSA
jgi:hypothetical protein